MTRVSIARAAAALVAVVAGGCGLGAGPGTADVQLTVTRDFGQRLIASVHIGQVPGAETVMRLLQRHLRVATRYGGGFVESIAGLRGTADRRDWFFYVDGAEGAAGAAATSLRRGDRVWWDLHDWRAAEATPEVVGAFPAPFDRSTAVVSCAAGVPDACTLVRARLPRPPGPPPGARVPVLVGPRMGGALAGGAGASGVYARFDHGSLALLDPSGEVVRRLGPGSGLVAATRVGGRAQWLVTGTDAVGVTAAARALSAAVLRDRFAVAVTAGGRVLALPLDPAA